MKPLRFHWLEGGYCRHLEKSAYRSGRLRMADYPSFFGVLEHPTEGIFLFDTGYSPRFHEATRRFPEKLYALATPSICSEDDACLAKLKKLKLSEADVKGIFISHFHADHVAALHYFPKAKLYFAGAGLRRVESFSRLRQVTSGFLANLLPTDVWSRAVLHENCKAITLPKILAPFTAGVDLLGDGSLLGVPLTGHMEGHTGLFFHCGKGPVLLVADAVWHSASIRENVGPAAPARLLIHNWSNYHATIRSLHEIGAREKELAIVPSHCTEFRGKFLG